MFTLGVLCLDTRFARLKGEIGNPNTFSFPVIVETVTGAGVREVVFEGSEAVVPLFTAAGRRLEGKGVDLIATSCGFVARFQDMIARALTVPFVSSSLLLLPLLDRVFGRRGPIGILTASRRHLRGEHLKGVGAEGIPVAVAGMDDCAHFTQAILREEAPLEPVLLENEAVTVARHLMETNPRIPALLLECTNLSPYRLALQGAVNRPVFDIVAAVMIFARGWSDAGAPGRHGGRV